MALQSPACGALLRCRLWQRQPCRLRHQRDPGTLRARLLRAVTQPVIREPVQCDTERRLARQRQREQRLEQSGYLRFLVGKCRRELLDAADGRMLLVCERLPHRRQFSYPYTNELFKHGLVVPRCQNEVALRAAAGTKWQEFFELLAQPGVSNVYIVGDAEPALCKEALRVVQRSPYLIALAGVVQDRMMTTLQLQEFARLPDLHGCRAQLLATLNAPARELLSTTEAAGSELVRLLADREKQLQ